MRPRNIENREDLDILKFLIEALVYMSRELFMVSAAAAAVWDAVRAVGTRAAFELLLVFWVFMMI